MKKINIDFINAGIIVFASLLIASSLLSLYYTIQGKKCLEWSKHRITGKPSYLRCLKWE